MKSLKDDTAAQAIMGGALQLILVIVVVGILAFMGLNMLEKISDKTALVDISAASSVLTLSGNTSCGERINITTVGGILVPMVFNISTGCAEVPRGSLNITVTLGGNGTTFSATNISGTINANATLSAVMTATNSSAGAVTLTYLTEGSVGNQVTISETFANGTWSGGGSLAGGSERDAFYNSTSNTENTVETGFDFLEILILAIVAGMVILAIFSYIPFKL